MRIIYLLPLLLVNVQPSQTSELKEGTEKNVPTFFQLLGNVESREIKDLKKGIKKHFPKFFENEKKMLKKLQQENRKPVLVIGEIQCGKSTLIGTLLGHKFRFEKNEVIEKLKNGVKSAYTEEIFVNTSPEAPKIGHSTASEETISPSTYLDTETNLIFIDTPGLRGKKEDNSNVINRCNVLGLSHIIHKIGGVQCIISVISYPNFIEGAGTYGFRNLLNTTSNMLKNTLPETLASSMVLVFTKVPEHISKDYISNQLRKRIWHLMGKGQKNNMTDDDTITEDMYTTLFPSFFGIKETKNVPFFLVKESDLLRNNACRKEMLPALVNTIKIDQSHFIDPDPKLLINDEYEPVKIPKFIQQKIEEEYKPTMIPKFIQRIINNEHKPKIISKPIYHIEENSSNLSDTKEEDEQVNQKLQQQERGNQHFNYLGNPQPLYQQQNINVDYNQGILRELNHTQEGSIDYNMQQLQQQERGNQHFNYLGNPQPLYQQQNINVDYNQGILRELNHTQEGSIDYNMQQLQQQEREDQHFNYLGNPQPLYQQQNINVDQNQAILVKPNHTQEGNIDYNMEPFQQQEEEVQHFNSPTNLSLTIYSDNPQPLYQQQNINVDYNQGILRELNHTQKGNINYNIQVIKRQQEDDSKSKPSQQQRIKESKKTSSDYKKLGIAVVVVLSIVGVVGYLMKKKQKNKKSNQSVVDNPQQNEPLAVGKNK